MEATPFTPLTALVGGMLIGLATVLMMAMTGRIAGVSGIVARLLPPYQGGTWLSPLAFVAGLAAAPLVYTAVTGWPVEHAVSSNLPLVGIAGLLVGAGAVLGSGCTSGHGVCGIARLSPRSIASTLMFMATAIITVFVTRHIVGG